MDNGVLIQSGVVQILSAFAVGQNHKGRRRLLALGLMLLVCWGIGNSATLAEAARTQQPTLEQVFPPLDGTKHRHLNHLYAMDSSPLEHRTPVLLIPGRVQEHQRQSWWKRFAREVKQDPTFAQHYKLYLFLYDSTEELDRLAVELAQELRALHSWLPDTQQTVLVSYSLGGLIAREALTANPTLLERTALVFGIATPYQGSPMFDPQWFSRYLDHFSPVREWWDRVTYRAYLYNKKNLTQGLHWVNFDNSMPLFLRQPSRRDPVVVQSTVTPPLLVESAPEQAFKQRLVVHASYLSNPYTDPDWQLDTPPLVNKVASAPKAVVGSVLPFYGFTVHAVFTYMNRQLANLPTYSPDNPMGRNEHLYRYNDGIIPLSSALYLPPRQEPYRENLQELAQAADVCRVRVFEDIDHVDLGHYRLFSNQLDASDALHEQEPQQNPIEWVLHDLYALQQYQRADGQYDRSAYCR